MNQKKLHEIVCGRCGAHDMVPFKPRAGSTVMCRTCHGKQDKRPSRPTKRSSLPIAGSRKTWTIQCSECQAEDNVPFEPRPDSNVLCRSCHEKRRNRSRLREKIGATRGSRKSAHIPRIDHGTRVSYPITCESGGKHETLKYVPNTTGPILCTNCASSKFGRDWYQVELGSQKVEEYPFNCSTCDAKGTLPFEPHPNREYQCKPCLNGEGSSNSRDLKEFSDFKAFVKVRRS